MFLYSQNSEFVKLYFFIMFYSCFHNVLSVVKYYYILSEIFI